MASGGFDLTVATARIGSDIEEVSDRIAEKWSAARSVLVAFGAPSRGLHEIAKDEGTRLEADC